MRWGETGRMIQPIRMGYREHLVETSVLYYLYIFQQCSFLLRYGPLRCSLSLPLRSPSHHQYPLPPPPCLIFSRRLLSKPTARFLQCNSKRFSSRHPINGTMVDGSQKQFHQGIPDLNLEPRDRSSQSRQEAVSFRLSQARPGNAMKRHSN